MIRSFQKWWESLPPDIKEKYYQNEKVIPQLNHVNYIWATNLMNNLSEKLNPSVDESFECVKTGQINAISR